MNWSKTYPVTTQHFDKFQKYCEYWVNLLGLNEWDITYFHTEDIHNDGLASFTSDGACKAGYISLNTRWYMIKPTNKLLNSTALHEIAHVLCGHLYYIANKREIREGEITEATEAICNRIEKAFGGI